ncbi:MAG: hypothetical protein A2008_11270 [Candidatus Wallbacteria bacterium GWC2_49_35]|uniref:Uncharacterized protein n=1 Tax=Candidatus Wallbacteria bacterium GWC2_49_35 TaxID=1817813 RepID=A0A1F7WV54_9BACT|nr:MAG: hypothetical protein A2008_11270 [Candidatus Wallbacteria bacterium GWC2_49_35]
MNENVSGTVKFIKRTIAAGFAVALFSCAPAFASGGSSSQMTPFDSDEVGINLEIGDMASKSGDYDSAVSAYSRAYLLDNKNFAAVYNLAYTYQLKGALKEAVKYYKTAARIDGKRHEPYINMGAIFLIEANPAGASEMFKKALEIAPDNIDANFNLAIIDIDKGDHKSALASLAAASKSVKEKSGRDYFSIALKTALCRIALGEFDMAAKALDFQSDDAAEEIERYYLTGCMLHKSGKTDEAAKAFHKAVELAKVPEMEGLSKVLDEKIAQFKATKKTGRISN